MLQSKVEEILQKIKHQQNGDVSNAMNNMGLNYGLNYGVSIPQLIDIASTYEKNSDLAYDLLYTEVREAKIIASLLFDPNKTSIDQLLAISTSVNNIELVEQYSKNLYAKSNDLDATLPILFEIDKWQKLLALMSAGWFLKKNKDSNNEIVEWSTKVIMKDIEANDSLLQKAYVFLFQCLVSVSSDTKKEMVNLAEKLHKNENIAEQTLGKELLWLCM